VETGAAGGGEGCFLEESFRRIALNPGAFDGWIADGSCLIDREADDDLGRGAGPAGGVRIGRGRCGEEDGGLALEGFAAHRDPGHDLVLFRGGPARDDCGFIPGTLLGDRRLRPGGAGLDRLLPHLGEVGDGFGSLSGRRSFFALRDDLSDLLGLGFGESGQIGRAPSVLKESVACQ
jgi:hypothetical protein